MISPDKNLPTVYLKPGEIYFSDKPTMVSTVLGSCVSVTMFSASSCIGAICHGLLSNCKNNDAKICAKGQCMERYKYVDCSIYEMLKKINAAGLKKSELEVKFFGGSEMITSKDKKPGWKTVGQENIMTAARIIQSEGLNLISYDVGGTAGRKIHFNTGTGEVFLKRLNKSRNGIYCDDGASSYKRSGVKSDMMKIAI